MSIKDFKIFDKVITPEGYGTVVEFDPNDYGGRDIKVAMDSHDIWGRPISTWFHHEEIKNINNKQNVREVIKNTTGAKSTERTTE